MGADAQRRYIAALKREQIALRSGLEARGVVFRDVVSYYRVWNGFAATVSTRDIPQLAYPGSQVRTVRRAYPASGEPVPVPGPGADRAGRPQRHAARRGPRHRRRQRARSTATPTPAMTPSTATATPSPAAERGRAGDERDRARGRDRRRRRARAADPDRLAQSLGRRDVEALATTDQLIAGLEHAVDPNGDGDTSDHVPVALVGVNAPYAGLHQLARRPTPSSARPGLGTLVIAPAGQRGRRGARAAGRSARPPRRRDAIAVGALTRHRADPEDEPHARRRRARRGRRARRRPARRRQDRRPRDRHRPGRPRPRDRRASATGS